jgi:hypothetical protein
MSEILELSVAELMPDTTAVLENQGVPAGTTVSEQIEDLYYVACRLLAETATPVGVLSEISNSDFAHVYSGEGRNELRTPVGDMFERADHLALFAVTLGERPGHEIGSLFESNDFALACMLDSTASLAADRAAAVTERQFSEVLQTTGRTTPATGVLRYSPGYCGWHISGQKKLFEFLRPEQIGLTLRESFLMEPLKSVSGVIVAGHRDIHNFPISYNCCSDCDTRSCRRRLRTLFAG